MQLTTVILAAFALASSVAAAGGWKCQTSTFGAGKCMTESVCKGLPVRSKTCATGQYCCVEVPCTVKHPFKPTVSGTCVSAAGRCSGNKLASKSCPSGAVCCTPRSAAPKPSCSSQSGSCKSRCGGNDYAITGTCSFGKTCCKAKPVKPTCAKQGGSCKSRCGRTDSPLSGTCTGARTCCKERITIPIPNPKTCEGSCKRTCTFPETLGKGSCGLGGGKCCLPAAGQTCGEVGGSCKGSCTEDDEEAEEGLCRTRGNKCCVPKPVGVLCEEASGSCRDTCARQGEQQLDASEGFCTGTQLCCIPCPDCGQQR